MKKNLNPVLRNVLVIIITFVVIIILGVVATFGGNVVKWVLSLGWSIWIAIIVTALACGITFGIMEMRSSVKKRKREE